MSRDKYESIFDFIKYHSNDDVLSLRLKIKPDNLGFDLDYALMQIKCRQKTARKIPSFLENPAFLFPTALSSEQATDERVALFHAEFIPENSKVLDMTSGLGIDAMTISKRAAHVTAIDLDPLKTEHLKNNSLSMGIKNMTCINADSIEWLTSEKESFEVIFIDPARRDSKGNRLFSLSDCLPDVTSILDLLLERCETLIIKASPLLDISMICRELPGITDVFTVCAHGECKEILSVVKKGGVLENIAAVDLSDSGAPLRFSLLPSEIGNDCQLITKPETLESGYIYEPNPALMKINCGEKICSSFAGMLKLSTSTNLYHSEELHPSFPGKIFNIISLPDKKELKKMKGEKINTISRNYVIKAEDISKKYGLRQGYDMFLIGAGIMRKAAPSLLLCRKISN